MAVLNVPRGGRGAGLAAHLNSMPCTAVSSATAEVANSRTITFDIYNGRGELAKDGWPVELIVISNAGAEEGATVTAAVATGTVVNTLEANKHFVVKPNSAGRIVLALVQTGADIHRVAVRMPGGYHETDDLAYT